jgi:hypothetical protein
MGPIGIALARLFSFIVSKQLLLFSETKSVLLVLDMEL